MKAYHSKQEIKDFYLQRMQAHYDADEIEKGFYWKGGKGCAVGCTLHSGDHAAYESELGIPRIIARLEDGIFEGLSNERAKEFPLQFLVAVPVGAAADAAAYAAADADAYAAAYAARTMSRAIQADKLLKLLKEAS